MKIENEIIDDFKTESSALLVELEEVVNVIEDFDGTAFPSEKLQEFSQKIDRIMGAAKTLLLYDPTNQGIVFLANVSEMCKTMGYQAAALKKITLLPIFAGFWAETVEVMAEVLENIGDEEKTKKIIQEQSKSIQKRLAWLAEKVAPDSAEEKQKVIDLLKKL